jgi:hypothetical protein
VKASNASGCSHLRVLALPHAHTSAFAHFSPALPRCVASIALVPASQQTWSGR